MRKRLMGVGAVVVVLLSLIALVWMVRGIIRARRCEQFRRNLTAQGFPNSYAVPLSRLLIDYPTWRFEPLFIDDMSWDALVNYECKPGWNLVVYSTWAPDEWRRFGVENYTPYYAKDAKAYDSGAWYQASHSAIAYFMDPRNFLNVRDVFMFESLGFDADAQTEETVEGVLSSTFMAASNYDGGNRRFSALIVEVGRKLGLNPVFIAGRLASEQGNGSAQAFGKIGDALTAYYTNETDRIGNSVIWGKRFVRGNDNTTKVMAKGKAAYNGYYNFFNFRAYGLGLFEIKYNAWVEATAQETCERFLGPWNTQAKAIEGGSLKIKERYIDTCRHTRYFQKFSVLPQSKEFRWKQYMQNIAAPLAEARKTSKAYEAVDALDAPYRFLVPVYKAMPKRPSPDPAGGKSVYSPSR